ncbi:MAG: alanine racemase, partial [Phycisphaerae bacterium]|nr:alanine racemase [Phycisphaerae bacterium]
CADDADKTSTLGQFRRFMRTVDECGGRSGLTLHAANSAATIDLPETHLDMVRTGLALYGYQPGENLRNVLPLKPSLRLTGPLVQIKDVRAGSATGYGLTYTFARDARVGLVPVGYADGYPRSLSNVASMRVRGCDCPVRGRVSMDQTVIEITDVPDAAIGDEVEIISPDPSAPNNASNLARLAGTIPYEILSRLGTNRIKRVIVD